MRPVSFIHDLAGETLPVPVRAAARRLVLDLLGVAAVGATTRAAAIARRVAADQFASARHPVPVLFGAETASASGAAMAGAFTIDAMDAHDGYALAKGHAGCATLPTVLAFSPEPADAEFLARAVLGYEIGCRAGVALHRTAPDYHTSGAWMALAAAAIGARALGLSPTATREALGIAEYHGPRSQMMRCIEHPAMIKDGSGWGALAGASAALLAADGFTGAPALTMEDGAVSDLWADLGSRWLILEQYVKPMPVCRWAQPAVQAALALGTTHAVTPETIVRITVDAFHEAVCLAQRRPRTTEEAQYSLPYPLAAALVRGTVGPAEVSVLDDPAILRLADSVELRERPAFSAAFPARRFSEVTLTLADGRTLASGPVEADGDPERPLSHAAIRAKFRAYAGPVLGAERAGAIEACVLGGALEGLPALLGPPDQALRRSSDGLLPNAAR